MTTINDVNNLTSYQPAPDANMDASALAFKNLARMSVRWSHPRRKDHRDAQKRVTELYRNERWAIEDLARSGTRESPVLASRKPRFMPNLLRQVIRPLTYLYDAPPKRVPADVPKDAAQDEAVHLEHWMRKSLWDFGAKGAWDLAMGEVDRMVRLHGTVWVQLVWKPCAGMDFSALSLPRAENKVSFVRGEDGFDLLILSPRFFEVIPKLHNKTEAQAVILFPYYDEFEDGFLSPDPASGNLPGVYWDDKFMGLTRGFNVVPMETQNGLIEHGLGFIPGCVVRNEPTTSDFWVWGVGGHNCTGDLWDLAQLWREYLFTSMCARGQYWADRKPEAGAAALGPDALVIMPSGGVFSSVGLNADLAQIRSCVNTAGEAWARGSNIPASLVRIDEKQSNVSGRSWLLQSSELEDDRPERIKILGELERKLHTMAAKVLTAIHGVKYDGDLAQLDYAEYQPKLQHIDLMAELAFERDALGMGDLYCLRRLHPGVDDVTLERELEARSGSGPQGNQQSNAAQVAASGQDTNARTNTSHDRSGRTSDPRDSTRPGTTEPGATNPSDT